MLSYYIRQNNKKIYKYYMYERDYTLPQLKMDNKNKIKLSYKD